MLGPSRGWADLSADRYRYLQQVVLAKLYDRKTPLTGADLLNDRVLAFFEEHKIALLRMLTDRGTEYCGNPEHHEYELYLALGGYRSDAQQDPQSADRICERFHKNGAQRVLPGDVSKEAPKRSQSCKQISING